jgi:hypothetical protein
MIDILGFREVARDDAKITAFLESLREIAEQQLDDELDPMEQQRAEYTGVVFEAMFISDTVFLLGSVAPHRRSLHQYLDYALGGVVARVRRVWLRLLELDPPLTVRGCISFGRWARTGNFIAGSAVARAAEGENRTAGGLVWLDPSDIPRVPRFALTPQFDFERETPAEKTTLRLGALTRQTVQVPLKRGAARYCPGSHAVPTVDAVCVNPFRGLTSSARQTALANMERSFERGAQKEDVRAKRDLTMPIMHALAEEEARLQAAVLEARGA